MEFFLFVCFFVLHILRKLSFRKASFAFFFPQKNLHGYFLKEVKPSPNREMIKESNDQKLASANTTFSLKLVVENHDLTANAFSQTTMIHKCALLRIKKISENRDL